MASAISDKLLSERITRHYPTLVSFMDALSVIDDLTDLFPPFLDTYQRIVIAKTQNDRNRKLLEAISTRENKAGRRRLLEALKKTKQDYLVGLLLGKICWWSMLVESKSFKQQQIAFRVYPTW